MRCPDPDDANNPDCNTQFTVTFGGNPQLKAEEANQTTIGGVWEPIPGVSLGADWFSLEVKNQVTNGVPIATILDPALYDQYSSLVTRAATCAGGPPCPITAIDQTFVNIGRVKIQGIDVDARFTITGDDVRALQRARDRHVLHQVRRAAAGRHVPEPGLERVPGGRFGHHAAMEELHRGHLGIRGRGRRRSATRTRARTPTCKPTPTAILRRVGDMSLWDLQGSYTGFKNLTLTLGVKNMFDTDPPLTNSNLTFQAGYDPSYYDARARFVYGSVRYAFK